METGSDNINKLGLLKKLNGRTSQNVWGDARCDRIEGTDGTMFPPKLFQNLNENLKVYARDMCRTLDLEFQGYGNIHGIPTLT